MAYDWHHNGVLDDRVLPPLGKLATFLSELFFGLTETLFRVVFRWTFN